MSQSPANERLGGPLKEGSGFTPENQGWEKKTCLGWVFPRDMTEKRVPPHTLKPDWRHEQRMHYKSPQQLFANEQLFLLLKHRAFIPTSWEFPQHGQSSCVLNFVFQMLKTKPLQHPWTCRHHQSDTLQRHSSRHRHHNNTLHRHPYHTSRAASANWPSSLRSSSVKTCW